MGKRSQQRNTVQESAADGVLLLGVNLTVSGRLSQLATQTWVQNGSQELGRGSFCATVRADCESGTHAHGRWRAHAHARTLFPAQAC
eukprot:2081586-Alexandrium_andersonii.AAC.1